MNPLVQMQEAIGHSNIFLQFQETLSKVAAIPRPVILVGERGVGKEQAASRIHYLSPRWESPFVTINCAALAPTLIETELFGHEPGAFTGAKGRRAGRFETANEGTLFIDELGATPFEVQEKILRVVEYGSFERVGGSAPIETDVRIVAATNADLPDLVKKGKFKGDLLDRLSFEVIFVPPLRVRGEDILLLAHHFSGRICVEMGIRTLPAFSADAEKALMEYPWPGNVRELKNVVERSVYRAWASGKSLEPIREIHFDPFVSPYLPLEQEKKEIKEEKKGSHWPGDETGQGECLPQLSFPDAVSAYEVKLIRNALQKTRHNQKKAAKILGLTYNQFRGLFRKYRDQLDG